jgi:hypothetical protein
MSERLINSAWRFVLIALVFILASAAMFQLYQAMLELLEGHWRTGAVPAVAGFFIASAVYWIARHRGDLVDI